MIRKLLLNTRLLEEYNPNKKRKIIIVFDDMMADIQNNENLIKK